MAFKAPDDSDLAGLKADRLERRKSAFRGAELEDGGETRPQGERLYSFGCLSEG